jgi:hypothetical protein
VTIPSSIPSHPESGRAPSLRVHVFGHASAFPAKIADEFAGVLNPADPSECDLAIFVINPATGIDPDSIAVWEALNDAMVPRLVAVTGLDSPEADFDDAVLLANRVFDLTVTPYLVLHDDAGIACALISLEDMKIYDYTTLPPKVLPSDSEHLSLVEEFRSEYMAALDVMGKDAFAAGLMFPAIPVWIEKEIGVDILRNYINSLAG